MNMNDRNVASRLIEQAFSDKISALNESIKGDAGISECQKKIIISLGLRPTIAKLEKLKAQVKAVEERLLLTLLSTGKKKKRNSDEWDDLLCQMATEERDTKGTAVKQIEELKELKRELLAKVSVATTLGELNVIYRQAGVIKSEKAAKPKKP